MMTSRLTVKTIIPTRRALNKRRAVKAAHSFGDHRSAREIRHEPEAI
jgi:hypothetical protein